MTKEHSVCRAPVHVSEMIITRQNQDTRSIYELIPIRSDVAIFPLVELTGFRPSPERRMRDDVPCDLRRSHGELVLCSLA